MGAVPFGFLSIHSENMGSFSFMMAHVVIDVFSNGAIFPDYSYESMDLRILRYGEIGRQPFAG